MDSKHPLTKKIIGVVVVVVVFLVCRNLWRGGDDTGAKAPEVPRPVKTVTVGDAFDMAPRSFPGRVAAGRSVDLSFEVSGKLKKLNVKEGQEVKAGTVLSSLDDRDFKSRLAAAQAKATETAKQFERAKNLLAEKVISAAAFDTKQATAKAAAADLKLAEKALVDTVLKAPFDGTISTLHVENHQSVRAKQAIMGYQDLSLLEVTVHVPERDVYYAEKGNPGKLSAIFEADPKREHAVTFKEISTEADSVTQAFKVTLELQAPQDVNLLPGMTATVHWRPKQDRVQNDTFLVPVTAVKADEVGVSSVWVVDPKTMRIKAQPVTVGELTGESVMVLKGLSTGQIILTAGVHRARENMLVSFIGKKAQTEAGGR
ncbi:MAG: efflux RND transporter periplasmic adaptor subunit [Planctomycetota bacterium]|jgi:RND family efflux transporter MFP subunit